MRNYRKSLAVYVGSVATIASIIILQQSPILLTTIVALISVLMLAVDWRIGRLIIFLFALTSAATVEILAIQHGIWSYHNPDIFGLPYWIPFVWANGAFFFIQIKETFDGQHNS